MKTLKKTCNLSFFLILLPALLIAQVNSSSKQTEQSKKTVKNCPYKNATNASQAIENYEWMNNMMDTMKQTRDSILERYFRKYEQEKKPEIE